MAGNRVVSSQDTIDLKGKVFQGTCGWSDSSIVKCGKFYPSSVKTTEDRLLHYSRFFPCVECDSSNYAIPSPAAVEKWIKCVPAGFKFHFKAFGFFTRKSVPLSVLPHIVRDELPENFTRQHSSVTWDELTQAQLGKLWDKYNSALLPAYQKNKLGVVVFQFHIGFHPTDENKRHVVECRKYLDVHYPMAAEFRSRVWFSVENLSTTLDWLNQHNIGLVVADDLESELYVKSSSVSNEKNSVSDRGGVVPIVMELGSCDFGYIRVHRRTGKDRILREQEIKSWGERLRSPELQSKIQGPIYFMWGTDHEDQPIINSKNLTKEIGTLAFDWKNKISNTGMLRFYSKAAQGNHTAQKTKAVLQNEDDDDEKRAAFLNGTVRSEIGLSETAINDEVERGGNSSLPLLASPRSESTKISSSGSAKKRTLSSAGSTSPKKRQTSTGIRGRNSTPTNQRMISDFFKK